MMRLKRLELTGFKSFARKTVLDFSAPVTAIVGPNGSGKSNIAEAMRFVLGEQSMKSMRGKRGEDLIFNGSKTAGRLNHAIVAIAFDNSDRIFNIDYDEVVLGREVFRDGTNEYKINGTAVRLKDIVELLSVAHIGSSAHHIISQGETDRFLFASIKERRIMIEDALGLRIYQYKINESQKKLAKTEENVREVGLLRKELAPRITFLKKQMERIERVRQLRQELKGIYAEYLKKEELYLQYHSKTLSEEIKKPQEELGILDESIQKAREHIEALRGESAHAKEILALEHDMRSARNKKDELSRALGRIEGMIEFEMRRREREKQAALAALSTPKQQEDTLVGLSRVREMLDVAEEWIDEALSSGNTERMREVLKKIKSLLHDFIEVSAEKPAAPEEIKEEVSDEAELEKMREEKTGIEEQMNALRAEEERVGTLYAKMKEATEKEKDATRDTERELFDMMSKRNDAALRVNSLRSKIFDIERENTDFKAELSEAGVLIGMEILTYGEFPVSLEETLAEEREIQRERKKKIERMKIRIEEVGIGGGDDIVKEFDEVTERDLFLERELADLEKSAASLGTLIDDLSEKLQTEFKEGLEKINKQFQEFFTLLFGGGTAGLLPIMPPKKKKKSEVDEMLAVEEEGEEIPTEDEEEGLDINISLPHKRLRGIQMLSGGERTLTSIALLFAVSQVNPPPFLVLDETDAALDEANSKKYGDMLDALSKTSELLIITHNRETMSHAGVIYGVTAGADAVSKILSIKFEDAEGMMAR
jgi:chromosome segregation protein